MTDLDTLVDALRQTGGRITITVGRRDGTGASIDVNVTTFKDDAGTLDYGLGIGGGKPTRTQASDAIRSIVASLVKSGLAR